MKIDEIAELPIIQAWRRNDEYRELPNLADDLKFGLLNSREELDDNMQAAVSELDSLFQFNTLEQGATLYRGTSRYELAEHFFENKFWECPAFMSTTPNISVAQRFYENKKLDEPIMLHIVLEQKLNVINANSSKFGGVEEEEFILPRNIILRIKEELSENVYKVGVSKK